MTKSKSSNPVPVCSRAKTPNHILGYAREMRKNSTPAESLLWTNLRNRKLCNLKFRRQQQLEGFIIDFYCEEMRLGFEVGGEIHFRQEQWEYDIQRTGYLAEFEMRIIRFTNEEVNSNIKEVLSKISNEAYIKSFTPASCLGHLSPWGEGQG